MYTKNDDGNVKIVIDPKDDPEFKKILDRIDNLRKELDDAIHELMFYSHDYKILCSIEWDRKE